MKKPIIIEIIIWIILLILIFCALVYMYSKIFILPNIYTIQFKDIDGITSGSPVRFMGMNIGYVRKLASKDKHINVQIVVTKKDMKIPNGTSARVEFYGLGGSKSIELTPPDGSCNVGILTDSTIRINDVVREVVNIVDIIEGLERYVKGFNKPAAEHIFDTISVFNKDTFKDADKNIKEFSKNQEEKINKMRFKEKELQEKIEKADEMTQKINQFIKK